MADPQSHPESPAIGHRRLLSSMLMLGTVALSAKVVALAKDLLVARQLGAGDALDAYFVAMVIPSYAAVVLGHTFASGFMPTYVRLWQRDGLRAAQQLAGEVLAAAFVLVALTWLAVLVLSPLLLPLVGSGFDAQKLALTRVLFYTVSGIIIAASTSAVLAAVLNAHERFAATALAPAAIPIGTLVVFAAFGSTRGVHALAGGTVVGFVAETGVLAAAAWRANLLPRPRKRTPDGELTTVGRHYLPVVVAGMLMSGQLLVDQSMAASLGTGAVSVLNYGGKVVAVVLAVVAVSISTVLFPRFSHLIAAGELPSLRRTFAYYAWGILLLSIPGVALLAWISEPLVRVLFERGEFTAEATAAVAHVQLWLLPQIPFYVLWVLGGRVLSALDGNRLLLRIAAMNLLANVVGNYLLMQRYGVAGIAMATSLMYVLATVATLIAIRLLIGARRR